MKLQEYVFVIQVGLDLNVMILFVMKDVTMEPALMRVVFVGLDGKDLNVTMQHVTRHVKMEENVYILIFAIVLVIGLVLNVTTLYVIKDVIMGIALILDVIVGMVGMEHHVMRQYANLIVKMGIVKHQTFVYAKKDGQVHIVTNQCAFQVVYMELVIVFKSVNVLKVGMVQGVMK